MDAYLVLFYKVQNHVVLELPKIAVRVRPPNEKHNSIKMFVCVCVLPDLVASLVSYLSYWICFMVQFCTFNQLTRSYH